MAAPNFVTVTDAAGVDRRVRRVDAREITDVANAVIDAPVENNDKQTSPEVAAKAAAILADEDSTPDEKSVAASALAQAPKKVKK